MAEIENMSRRNAKSIEHFAVGGANGGFRRKKRSRVEISLKRDTASGQAASFARIARPIQADCVATARHHRCEPGFSALGDQAAPHAPALELFIQARPHLAPIREPEGLLAVERPCSSP